MTGTYNFLRMTGELDDWNYPDEEPQYDIRQTQSGYIMVATLCLLGTYIVFLKPLGYWKPSPEAVHVYDDTGLASRIPKLFSTWREYENVQYVLV